MLNVSSLKTIITVTIVLVIATLVTPMFNPFKKQTSSKIVDIVGFECNGLSEFTFKYPVFKDTIYEKWSFKNDDLNGFETCHTFLKQKINDSYDYDVKQIKPWHIMVRKKPRHTYPTPNSSIVEYPPEASLKNEFGVHYNKGLFNSISGERVMNGEESLTFYTNNFVVEIDLSNANTFNWKHFSSKMFLDTVIKNFRELDTLSQ